MADLHLDLRPEGSREAHTLPALRAADIGFGRSPLGRGFHAGGLNLRSLRGGVPQIRLGAVMIQTTTRATADNAEPTLEEAFEAAIGPEEGTGIAVLPTEFE